MYVVVITRDCDDEKFKVYAFRYPEIFDKNVPNNVDYNTYYVLYSKFYETIKELRKEVRKGDNILPLVNKLLIYFDLIEEFTEYSLEDIDTIITTSLVLWFSAKYCFVDVIRVESKDDIEKEVRVFIGNNKFEVIFIEE